MCRKLKNKIAKEKAEALLGVRFNHTRKNSEMPGNIIYAYDKISQTMPNTEICQ